MDEPKLGLSEEFLKQRVVIVREEEFHANSRSLVAKSLTGSSSGTMSSFLG